MQIIYFCVPVLISINIILCTVPGFVRDEKHFKIGQITLNYTLIQIKIENNSTSKSSPSPAEGVVQPSPS